MTMACWAACISRSNERRVAGRGHDQGLLRLCRHRSRGAGRRGKRQDVLDVGNADELAAIGVADRKSRIAGIQRLASQVGQIGS